MIRQTFILEGVVVVDSPKGVSHEAMLFWARSILADGKDRRPNGTATVAMTRLRTIKPAEPDVRAYLQWMDP